MPVNKYKNKTRPLHQVYGLFKKSSRYRTCPAKPKAMADVQVKFPKQKTSDGNKQEKHEDNKPKIDRSRVKIKSTLKVKDKYNINTIVPLQNKTTWIQAGFDPYLILIDSRGEIITKSVSLEKEIFDAKQYKNGLLVTCHDQCTINNLSIDGKSISTFSDLSPYYTRGLCITHDMDVMVCLRSSTDSTDNKVFRLNTEGTIIQKIPPDAMGSHLYINPWKITTLPTGEVIVIDWNRIVSVDGEGKHLFTWEGEIQGKKLDMYSLHHITHDSNNNLFVTDQNHRVLVLGKDGTGAMSLLDSTQEIFGPLGEAVDYLGHLWVGNIGGFIYIIEY